MKKAILSIAVLSALGFSAVTQAAPTVGATGMINFTGSINADSCVAHSNGAGTSGGANLTFDMNAVSKTALGTEANPNASSGTSSTLPVPMNLALECSSGTSVDLKLTPTIASGKGIGLAPVAGAATNVQIMLMQAGQPLDFTSGSVTLNAPLVNGVASVPLTAYYTLKSGKTVADVTAGTANASAAYVLSYN
ncbi:fimbrial protein [uncultured Comamonas sp.]|uniref:fimbrial protein n=1 Tax=uncultured Comamonas sp. TaxID=114710 RepID=UPI0025DEFF08|nr:fimbrial protein [uncultured Comamonas sp.]